jgi:hypothetical protein
MTLAKERDQMMLAKTEGLDVFDNYHLVIGNVEQGAIEYFIGTFLIPAGQISKGAIDSLRGFNQTITLGIFAKLNKNAAD